ncbi:50S ribosomal protein L10 [bacterium]|nr:50S ribosomal protein L10 [bacterium]
MNKDEKAKRVKELVRQFQKSPNNMVFTDYKGLTVKEISGLRETLNEKGILYKVIKNRLACLALKESGLKGLDQFFTGPTAIAFAQNDPTVPAKALSKCSKEYDCLNIKGGFIDELVFSAEQIREIALIPSRDQLLMQLIGQLQAPIGNFVYCIRSILARFVYVIHAVIDNRTNSKIEEVDNGNKS